MALRPVAYDINRLITRIFNGTPNGIDRVDIAFADYFLNSKADGRSGLMMTALGPRVLAPDAARRAIEIVRKHWGEDERPEQDPALDAVLAALNDRPKPMERVLRRRTGQMGDILAWLRAYGLRIGAPPRDFLSSGGLYMNCSQFPLEFDAYFSLMDRRRDLESVFFIHDALPMETPEYFRPSAGPRQERKLATLVRRGDAVIVASEAVRSSLTEKLAALGRPEVPILVAPLPVDPVFRKTSSMFSSIPAHPYFVMCATIEPRKNHLLILHAWRDLAAKMGDATPKLVLIGRRGWENEHIIDLLERCPGLQRHVVEVAGLPTPSVHKLLLGARALLMPSFAEGYGLPIVEALASGTPVIASNISTFDEVGGDHILMLDPTDGPAWRQTIMDFACDPSPRRDQLVERMATYRAPDWATFFANVETFISDLPRTRSR